MHASVHRPFCMLGLADGRMTERPEPTDAVLLERTRRLACATPRVGLVADALAIVRVSDGDQVPPSRPGRTCVVVR
jgi:hypothetical protein